MKHIIVTVKSGSKKRRYVIVRGEEAFEGIKDGPIASPTNYFVHPLWRVHLEGRWLRSGNRLDEMQGHISGGDVISVKRSNTTFAYCSCGCGAQ